MPDNPDNVVTFGERPEPLPPPTVDISKPSARLQWAMDAYVAWNLNRCAERVLMHLAMHGSNSTGACTHSLKRIAKDTGMARSEVCYALRNLQDCGLVVVQRRRKTARGKWLHSTRTATYCELT